MVTTRKGTKAGKAGAKAGAKSTKSPARAMLNKRKAAKATAKATTKAGTKPRTKVKPRAKAGAKPKPRAKAATKPRPRVKKVVFEDDDTDEDISFVAKPPSRAAQRRDRPVAMADMLRSVFAKPIVREERVVEGRPWEDKDCLARERELKAQLNQTIEVNRKELQTIAKLAALFRDVFGVDVSDLQDPETRLRFKATWQRYALANQSGKFPPEVVVAGVAGGPDAVAPPSSSCPTLSERSQVQSQINAGYKRALDNEVVSEALKMVSQEAPKYSMMLAKALDKRIRAASTKTFDAYCEAEDDNRPEDARVVLKDLAAENLKAALLSAFDRVIERYDAENKADDWVFWSYSRANDPEELSALRKARDQIASMDLINFM